MGTGGNPRRGAATLAAVLWTTAAAGGSELGTYAQPTLHGQRLIFVSEEDLWTAEIPEADQGSPIIAHRLTSGDGVEQRPRISPDGEWVAFAGQYDGNTDVYLMPAVGGAARRLTFHPGADEPLGWSGDSRFVLFRSGRAHPLGRGELFRVARAGGMPGRYAFGECSMITLSPGGRRFALTRWSNEGWSWKRYRGGAAPEIWVGDFDTETFRPLTEHPANDLFPMWLMGRVFFLSDRTGTANIFSDAPEGGDARQHTTFAPQPEDSTAIDGYDVRWPSGDMRRRGHRIVFCQAGLALLDVNDDTVARLDVRIASDRVARRRRFAGITTTMTECSLAPDGARLLVGARGEIVSLDTQRGEAVQLTHSSGARDWGATYMDDEQVVMISDMSGDQQVAMVPADASEPPSLVTQDRQVWLFPPEASPDGRWLVFGDKTCRLHTLDLQTLEQRQVDSSEAGEITDYRFSPDSQWIAFTKPMPNGTSLVHIHSLRTGRSFPVSDGLHVDTEPRWDPAGRYLYFLSQRHLNPVLDTLDMEHVHLDTTVVVALPLAQSTPPPVPRLAEAAGFDLKAWGRPAKATEPAPEEQDQPLPEEAAADQVEPMMVDTEGMPARQHALPIEPGRYRHLEAVRGGVLLLSHPVTGLHDRDRSASPWGPARAALLHHDLVKDKSEKVAEKVATYALSADDRTIAHPREKKMIVRTIGGGNDDERTIDLEPVQIRVDVPAEWQQIFDEAWRLQRDFYWAENFAGVDWPAMREKYAALLPRVGTRRELNDLIGEMVGELSTSHTYVWGGEHRDEPRQVTVGLLGADIQIDRGAFRFTSILPSQPWGEDFQSPLAMPHLGVRAGSVLLAINGEPLTASSNVYDLLQGQAGKLVRLTVAAEDGSGRRTIAVPALHNERKLRYAAWVERNRQLVREASGGSIGYLHVPDMHADGLTMFSRLFYPQFDKAALVIDIRGNGGGFVSQMILQRLARQVLAYDAPRHGVSHRYPARGVHGHLAVLIDEHAGSDGDMFPAMFRRLKLGPLIGTRTWGGVIGVRGDKPFVDMGVSTQPEYAWWDIEEGWTIENEGVQPDMEVLITPEDRAAGRDPQLQKAIDVLLSRLQESPREVPKPPPYPRH